MKRLFPSRATYPRKFIHFAPIAFLWMCLATRSVIATDRPNILWITCEDMSADLSCYGDPVAHTPNLDHLVSEGARFTHAFAVAPVCAPARSSLITGMYPTTIGTQHMRSKAAPPPYVRCFTEYLRAAGYYCTNNSKTDYNFDSPPTAWDESNRRAHWRNRPDGTPFFSVFNLTITHESKFHMDDEQFDKLFEKHGRGAKYDLAKVPVPPYFPDTPVVRKHLVRYYDMVTEMDRQVGEILAELEQDELTSNTVVFFFSDHGRGLPREKRWLYDSGLHVPLIIRHPGATEPRTIRKDLVSFVDFAPTVLKLANVEIPKHLQGQPFLGKDIAARELIFGARDRMNGAEDTIRCVRDAKFKYIRNYEQDKPYDQIVEYSERVPVMQELRRVQAEETLNDVQKLFFRQTKPKEELYNCLSDPHEVHNLADNSAYADDLKRLRQQLEQWRKDTGDLGTISETELQKRMYPGGVVPRTASPRVNLREEGDKKIVALECETEGASLTYRLHDGRHQTRWLLYSKPVIVDAPTTLTARASRLGWEVSRPVEQVIE